MGMPSDSAAYIPAPKVGDIEVVAVADVAIAAEDTGIEDGTQWFTFSSDVDVFISFGPTNAETAPSATGVAGDSRAWPVYANTTADFVVDRNRRFFRAICNAAETGFLRYRRSA